MKKAKKAKKNAPYVYRTHIKIKGKIPCGGSGKNSTIVDTITKLRAAEEPCRVCDHVVELLEAKAKKAKSRRVVTQ